MEIVDYVILLRNSILKWIDLKNQVLIQVKKIFNFSQECIGMGTHSGSNG